MKKLLRSELISIEEKGKLIQLMHNKNIRTVMTEILGEITAPKVLKHLECLKVIADIIKFILTCKITLAKHIVFVHEQSNDYKLLYVILESSQNIYYVVIIPALIYSVIRTSTGSSSYHRYWQTMGYGRTQRTGKTA